MRRKLKSRKTIQYILPYDDNVISRISRRDRVVAEIHFKTGFIGRQSNGEDAR